ncbi:O-antigen polymerase [Cytobacillus firmus]|uniref:O-antigen polymerase n=1 Tax=Cytobacillus firmus TaxID=1399 RepID=UPI0024C20BDD|nr:O-antigen polymerase [Cytobacillus firmus]WHY61509.1 O-antigen polymerase [Cytobacillus firmus]
MILCILLITVISLIINFIQFKNFLNFVNVFLLMWCVASVLSWFGFYGMYVPPMEAYLYIFILLFMFELSCLLFLRINTITHTEKQIFSLNWRKINIFSIICTIIITPFAIKGIALVLAEGFYRLRLTGFTEMLYSNQEKLLLINIIQPLVLAISILSLIELIKNKKVRVSLIISVFNCLLYILVFGGRWLLLEFLLLAGIILIDIYGANIIKLVKNNRLLIVVIASIFLTIALITNQRSVGGGEGLLYNVYVYFVGSLHLFGVYISNPLVYSLGTEHLLFGREFFAGILEPIYLIANFSGLDWKSGIESINEVTQQFVAVSPATYMNNNVTMIYAFLRDFGFLGIIICPVIIGAVYTHLYKAKKQSPNDYRESIYYYGLSIMPFLLFEWMPARMSIIMVPIFLFLLTRKSFFKIR